MRKRIVRSRKRIKNRMASEIGSEQRKRAEGVCENSTEPKEKKNVSRALACIFHGELTAPDSSDGKIQDERQDIEHFCDNGTSLKNDRSAVNTVRLVCGAVVVLSLFFAVVLTCFAFAVATEYYDDSAVDADTNVDTELDSESEKIIFVRPDDGSSGILTASEIYEKCAKSAVSVSVERSDTEGCIGSGFIVSSDGYIATAEQVVRGSKSIRVILSDGREYNAELTASDRLSDIALLKIEAEELSAVEFGKSSELIAGERIYTIGTPTAIEYAGTLGTGRISAPQRLVSIYTNGLDILEKRLKLIQISAEVGKGSSGCPLFDEYGRAVGMVTARSEEMHSGMGFALPSDGLAEVICAMKEKRELNSSVLSGVVLLPPKLGITGESVAVGGVYGYKISGFSDVGSTAEGILKIGDVLLQINRHIITDASHIESAIEKNAPGDTVSVTVMRAGQRLTYEIVLGE